MLVGIFLLSCHSEFILNEANCLLALDMWHHSHLDSLLAYFTKIYSPVAPKLNFRLLYK